MSQTTSDSTGPPKVLIVGAGPVGLVAALALLRNGVPVRIIEKSTTPRIGQRGAGISPRTIEVFESLGFVDKVLKGSIPPPTMRLYKLPGGTEVLKEFELNEYEAPTPDRPYNNPRLLGQEVLDRISQSELEEKYGSSVELGVELKHLEQIGDRVHVKLQKHNLETEEAVYDYVLGADGAKGAVRKLLGLSFLGETREQTFIIGDCTLEGLSQDKWHIWGDFSHVIVNARPTETPGLFNFIFAGNNLPEHMDTDQEFADFFREHTGGRDDIKIKKIIYKSYYRVNVRMVDTYRQGGVFLAGDAAHIHSPAGGQGLNTGVQDAFNFAWKLALAVKGFASPSLLDTFNEERIKVASEVLKISTTLLTKSIAAGAIKDPEKAIQRRGELKQFGVNYRSSSIVIDDGLADATSSAYGDGTNGPVQAGDRAPDAPGLVKKGESDGAAATRLFHLLNPSRHTVLLFSDKLGAELQHTHPVLSRYPADLVRFIVITGAEEVSPELPAEIYRDSGRHTYEAYKDSDQLGKIFVVRPDGHVGARLATLDRVALYFKGIFGNHF